MSMVTLTIIQAISIFLAYIFVTIALPAVILHKRLKSRRLAERIVFYYLFGNTYVINLVLFLGLLKIHNRWTLLLFTVIPLYFAGTYINHVSPQGFFRDFSTRFRRLFTGIFGVRNAIYRTRIVIGEFLKRFIPRLWRAFYRHLFEWILVGLLAAVIIWAYGKQLISYFGYGASDIPVHNMWVNYMSPHEGKPGIPFGAGVYPFGMHCVIYFFHEVFGFDTYVLFRVFYICQDFMIYLMLAMFLKLSLKTNYLAYGVTIVTIVFKGFRDITHLRYASSLPQEYGMIFILPGIYFLFQYFSERRLEIKAKKEKLKQMAAASAPVAAEPFIDPEEKRRKELQRLRQPPKRQELRREHRQEEKRKRKEEKLKQRRQKGDRKRRERRRRRRETRLAFSESKTSWYCLSGFIMSFGLTLAVHFYDTMIAALFVVGVGCGFVFWIFRRYYFWSLLMAGIISIMMAVTPMAIAVIGGTPLQGSLSWGMSVITGEDPEYQDQDLTGTADADKEKESESEETESVTEDGTEITAKNTKKEEKKLSIKERLVNGFEGIKTQISETVFMDELGRQVMPWILLSVAALYGMALFFWLIRRWFYGARLLSAAVYMTLLFVMMAAGSFQVPALMDPARSCIYAAYSVGIPFAFLLDGVCYLIRLIVRWKRSMQLVSLLLTAAMLVYTVKGGFVGEPVIAGALQTNSAITCLTNIIRDNKDFTYTIVSATDERNMAFDHAYHTELITFLRQMEFYTSKTKITIPSEKIFFFVEKIPVVFGGSSDREGQRINLVDANQMLDFGSGISAYQTEVRWTTMARMFYWAETFRQMYPDEMTVYFETDEFVCYELKQNPYRAFNLAIDYEYNTVDWNKIRSEKW